MNPLKIFKSRIYKLIFNIKNSLKLKTIFIVIAVLSVSLGIKMALNIIQMRSIIYKSVEQEIYASGLIIRNTIYNNLRFFELDKFSGMSEFFKGVLQSNPNLSYTFISELKSKKVLYHSRDLSIGSSLRKTIYTKNVLKSPRIIIQVAGHYELIIPIMYKIDQIGNIHIAVKKSYINDQIVKIILTNVIVFIISLFVTILILLLFITRNIVKPISSLSNEMEDITNKIDFNKKIKVKSLDEIGKLAKNFNLMMKEICTHSDNLKDLVDKLGKTKAEIEKINEISKQVSLSTDLNIIIDNAYNYIKETYGFNNVTLSLVNKDKTHYTVGFAKTGDVIVGKEHIDRKLPLNSETGGRVADCILNNKVYYYPDVNPEEIENEVNRKTVETFNIKSILHVPVAIGNNVFGCFSVCGLGKNIFLSEHEIESILTFVNQIAITIRNISLLEESVKKQKEIEKIDEITRQVSISVNLGTIFNNVSDYIKETYGFNSIFLNLVNKAGTHYKAEFTKFDEKYKHLENSYLNKQTLLNPIDGGRIADCILNNKVYYFHTVDSEKIENEANRKAVEALNLKCGLHIPIAVGNNVLGSFTLLGMGINVILSEEEISSIQMFVNQIAITLRNIRLLDETVKKQEEIEQLNEITKIIGISLDFDTVFNRILEYLKSIYSFEGAYISLADAKRERYSILKSSFPDYLKNIESKVEKINLPLTIEEGGRVADCIINNKHYFFTDIDPEKIENMVNRRSVEEMKLKSILHVPIFLDNAAIGALSLTSHSYSFYLNDDDIEVIKRFVNQIAVTLRNVRLYEIIEKEKSFSENLLERSPFAIQVISKEGKLIYINPACKTITGYGNKDIIGANYLEYESIKKCGFDKAFLNALNGEYIKMEDVNFSSSITGKNLIINITFSPIYGKNNQTENVLVMYYDNTEKAQAMDDLRNALEEINIKNKIINEDLLMAKRIQTNILSRINNNCKLDFDIHFKPMMEVGGDIYDVLQINENHYRIFIADATGHGIQAALTTMIIKSEYDKIKIFEMEPNLIMNILNNAFCNNYSALAVFFTCAIIDINFETKKILFSSAGHPDQYLITKNDIISLNTDGKIVGVFDKVNYGLKEINFSEEGKIILFTDGIFEEFSQNEEEFGEERLFEIIRKNKNKKVADINKTIMKDLSKWIGKNSFSDDITLIGIENK